MPRLRNQFSLKTLIVCTMFVGAILACYSKMRFDSARQAESIAELESRGGGYWEREAAPFRIGHWLGLEYPADVISAVKGSARADWGMVPGWKCTDNDIALLGGFPNVEDVYLSNSKFTNVSMRHLQNLPKLQKLEFYKCDLTECTLAILADETALRKVVFRNSRIANESFRKFREVAPQIEVDRIGG